MNKYRLIFGCILFAILAVLSGCDSHDEAVVKTFENEKLKIAIEVSAISKMDVEFVGHGHVGIPIPKRKYGYQVQAMIEGHPATTIDLGMHFSEMMTREQIIQRAEKIKVDIAPNGEMFKYELHKAAVVYFLMPKGPLFASKDRALLPKAWVNGQWEWSKLGSVKSMVTKLIADTRSGCSQSNKPFWEAVEANVGSQEYDDLLLQGWPQCKKAHALVHAIAKSSSRTSSWEAEAYAKAKQFIDNYKASKRIELSRSIDLILALDNEQYTDHLDAVLISSIQRFHDGLLVERLKTKAAMSSEHEENLSVDVQKIYSDKAATWKVENAIDVCAALNDTPCTQQGLRVLFDNWDTVSYFSGHYFNLAPEDLQKDVLAKATDYLHEFDGSLKDSKLTHVVKILGDHEQCSTLNALVKQYPRKFYEKSRQQKFKLRAECAQSS